MTSRVLNIVCKFNLHLFLQQGLHFALGFAFLKILQEFRMLAFEEARSRPRLFEKMRDGLGCSLPTGVYPSVSSKGNPFFSYERRLKAEILEPQSDMELSIS